MHSPLVLYSFWTLVSYDKTYIYYKFERLLRFIVEPGSVIVNADIHLDSGAPTDDGSIHADVSSSGD
jgi:hypothetical protein